MAVVLALVVTVVFVIVRVTPGDPAAVMLGSDATPQDIADLRARMGLDAPLLVQYGQFVLGIFQGDLGQSIFLNQPVTQALTSRAEPTFFLTLFSILIAVLIALPVGVFSAVKRGTFFDQTVVVLTMVAASVPSFWLGLLHSDFRRAIWLVPGVRLWWSRYELSGAFASSDFACSGAWGC
jgi:peptide/nickel transport system permease protein